MKIKYRHFKKEKTLKSEEAKAYFITSKIIF